MIDFSFPENSAGEESAAVTPVLPPGSQPEPQPDDQPGPPWRADLLILLAAALAALGTFLYEAWNRTHPEAMI